MPHLTDLITARQGPFHTYEFFPPRTQPGLANLLDRIGRLATAPLNVPLAVSVTWGAGGSTADRSLDLAEAIVKMGLEVILHLTCTNMPIEKVDKALQRCRDIGIQNILALRGDAPRGDEYAVDANDNFDEFEHADDLIRYIRKQHGDYFCIGVAGYPTPHPDSDSAESDLHYLKVKVDAGANFIITQLFYDIGEFERWVLSVRGAGIDVPILPGVMPIQNFASFRRLANLTKCSVPPNIFTDLERIKADDAAVKQYGVRLATTMVNRLIASGLVNGVHFCTLNLEKSVRTILEKLGWLADGGHGSPSGRNQLIQDDAQAARQQLDHHSISPSDASQLAQWGLARAHEQQARQAVQSKPPPPAIGEDAWDEFPNGRFTDVRSPAFGEIDGWGSGLKTTPAQALKEWGTPATTDDLATLFTRYLKGDPSTPTTPFCDLPLSPESSIILDHLVALNGPQKKYWTVGSQPAVDSAPSDHPLHGWGPAGGYVWQKAFVEFFVPASEVDRLQEKLVKLNDGEITFYASNKKGEYTTNTSKDAVNAVTWAAFPGQEIVQSTIIEQLSFLAWKEEAFDIWNEWSLLYPRNSPARKLLDEISNEWWLVSLIHHDYKDPEGLWRFLLDN
ncbi:methylenetetrahydrofolate reductase 1 [Vanrija albida]|uniref:Methylenetetrahydrofolate reductase 1 n=1 Tax=Vanrija albida TaxID=181172 RepID=A0ABR3Q5E8_9TREE